MARGIALAAGERARRQEAVLPLVALMMARDVVALRVVRRCFERQGRTITKQHWQAIKIGQAPMPAWLVTDCLEMLGISQREWRVWLKLWGAHPAEENAS